MPTVKDVRFGRIPLDEVVAPVAALDCQKLFDVPDIEETAIAEFEPLDTVVEVEELVADAQCIGPLGDRDDKVIAVFREDDIGLGDVVAEPDDVILRHENAFAVGPGRADPGVDDKVLAVAHVKEVDVPAVATEQRVIAAPAVQQFRKVRAGDGFRAVRADKVDVFGIEVEEFEGAVVELEEFHGKLLLTRADILVLEDDLVSGAPDRHDQIKRGTGKLDVPGLQHLELDLLRSAGIHNGINTIARRVDIGIAPALALQPVIAKPAVDPVRYAFKSVDRVVAIGLGDVDIMLEKLEVIPNGAVAELDLFDQVGESDKQDPVEVIGHDDLILGTGYPQGQGVAAAIAQEVEIGPAQIIQKLKLVVFRTEQGGREVGVQHDILPVVPAEEIRVETLLTGQEVVPGATIQRIVIEHAVDGVVAIGLGILDHPADDLGVLEHPGLVENDLLDQVRSDVAQSVVRTDQRTEGAEVEAYATELPDQFDAVLRQVAIGILERDQEVVAVAVACQIQVIGRDIALEHEKIHARLNRPEREIAQVVDHVLPVTAFIDIGVPSGPAAQEIVAEAAEQNVPGPRPEIGVGLVKRRAIEVDDLERHAVAVPDLTVSKDDVVDTGLQLHAVGEVDVPLAEELVRQAHEIRAVIVEEDQVFAVAHGVDILGPQMCKAKLVVVSQIPVVDDVVTGIAADDINVGLGFA